MALRGSKRCRIGLPYHREGWLVPIQLYAGSIDRDSSANVQGYDVLNGWLIVKSKAHKLRPSIISRTSTNLHPRLTLWHLGNGMAACLTTQFLLGRALLAMLIYAYSRR